MMMWLHELFMDAPYTRLALYLQLLQYNFLIFKCSNKMSTLIGRNISAKGNLYDLFPIYCSCVPKTFT